MVTTADNARVHFSIAENGDTVLHASGALTLTSIAAFERELENRPVEALQPGSMLKLNLSGASQIDTFGGWFLLKLARSLTSDLASVEFLSASPEHRKLLERLREQNIDQPASSVPSWSLATPFNALGRGVAGAGGDLIDAFTVQGKLWACTARVLTCKDRFRFASLVTQVDRMGFRAVPIIALISFLVGAIVTQQSIFQLRAFGASIFVVDLAAVLMLREVGVLLTAIMIAGRSGSAITAELGSMRMREEIDALNVMGLDPYNVLLLPRVLALILVMPLLAFIASMAGLAGSAAVANIYADIPFATFIDRLRDAVTMPSIATGLIKAPFMAIVIGTVACFEGMKVEGSAESLGQHTTASVVKAIFMVIVADGLFAIFFAAINF